jgi:ATP-dependent helicase HrpB
VAADADAAGVLLAFAYPDRVALQRTPGEARYLLASGRGARLHESEMRLRQPCIVAASVDLGETEGAIYLAAPLALEQLRAHLASHITEQDTVRWDAQQQAVMARREQRLGALVLNGKPLNDADPEALRAAMLDGIRRMGIDALPWTNAARDWQARVLSLRHWQPEDSWPDVSDSALATTLAEWLGPYLDGVTRRDHLARLDLPSILAARLDWEQSKRLEEGAPTHITVPSGSRLRLEYRPGESPVLAVKLQEMFGLADTPRVAWGSIPVTLHLLSPAKRPIQVTQDLKGFWERTYVEVKKELKGRYPKHPWPDDPWNAAPTARTRRRP